MRVPVQFWLDELAGGTLWTCIHDRREAGGREACLHLEGPALFLHLAAGVKQLVDSPWDDASELWGGRTYHRVGLAAAGLAVGENAHLVAVQRALNQLRDLLKHLFLHRFARSYARNVPKVGPKQHLSGRSTPGRGRADAEQTCSDEGPNTRSKENLWLAGWLAGPVVVSSTPCPMRSPARGVASFQHGRRLPDRGLNSGPPG